MTDDFQLFPVAGGDPSQDADVALITAYLARELSLVQIIAVEERLASDVEFADKARLVIEAWALPSPLGLSGARTLPTTLTSNEIENGWQRRVAPVHRVPQTDVALPNITRARHVSFARIAAAIALVFVPVFVLALLFGNSVDRLDAPGSAPVRSGVTTSSGGPSFTLAAASGDLALIDVPWQQNFPQRDEQAAQTVPVVDLPPASAKSTRTLAAILGLKHTAEGRVLVNDPLSRQVLLFERDLATSIAVLDSVPGTSRSYGNIKPDPENASSWRTFGPFVGDSAVFGPINTAMNVNTYLVLDAQGNVARVMALNVSETFSPVSGTDHWDSKGRLLGTSSGVSKAYIASLGVPPARSFATLTIRSDTLLVLRTDNLVVSRNVTLDTLGTLLLPVDQRPRPAGPPMNMNLAGLGNGGGKHVPVPGPDGTICWWFPTPGPSGPPPDCPTTVKQVVNPLYVVDDWTLLSDGTIAFVRGHDYHIDWIHPDGTRSSSGKLPFEWRQLTDVDKQRIVDSTRAVIDSLDALALVNEEKWKPWKDSATKALRAAGARVVNRELAHPGPPERVWPYEIVPLSEIADYYPPIRRAAAKPDADGNLWILPRATSLSKQGELVYDVVNPIRGLAQRVRLPLGRSIAGFGKGGIVYLQHGDLEKGFILERTTLPAPIPR